MTTCSCSTHHWGFEQGHYAQSPKWFYRDSLLVENPILKDGRRIYNIEGWSYRPAQIYYKSLQYSGTGTPYDSV